MMSIGNEIKSDLTQWYDNKETPLPQGDWNEFKRKLDQKNKQRGLIRRYIYLTLGFCIVSLTILNTFYFLHDKSTITTQKLLSLKQKENPTEQTLSNHNGMNASGLSKKKPTVSTYRNSNNQKSETVSVNPQLIKPAGGIVQKENNLKKKDEVVKSIHITDKAYPITEISKGQITEEKKQVIADSMNIVTKQEKQDVFDSNFFKTDSVIAPKHNIEKKPSNSTKIAFKIVFSSDYTIGKSTTNSADAPKIHENYNLINKESEKAAISFTLGVNLEFFVMKNLSITSGLFYDKYSTGGKYDFYNNEIPVIDSLNKTILGYITVKDSVGVHYSINNNYSFLELPLILNYYIPLGEKWKLNLKAGGSMLYYLSSSGKTISANLLVLKDVNTYSYNTINWGLILGLGCYYRLSDKINIGLEPTYKQFLGSLMKNDQLTSLKPWSVGVNLNVQIKLK